MTSATYGWGRWGGVSSEGEFRSVGEGVIRECFLKEVAFELSHEGWSGFHQGILEKVG